MPSFPCSRSCATTPPTPTSWISSTRPAERTWIRLLATDDYELWLISWPPGAVTDWHDHGASSGAFTVLRGSLTEHTFDGGLQLVDHGVGDGKAFGAGYAHDVRNPNFGRPSRCTRTRPGSRP